MRILMTAGIFAPESGGPATYAPALATKLVEAGHHVTVMTMSDKSRYEEDQKYKFSLVRIVRARSTVLGVNRVMNRIRFFLAIASAARSSDLIYTLDWFAVGLPVAVAARIWQKPYVVRVGGDYLWEQKYLESGAEPVTLVEFYARGLHLRPEYRIASRIIHFVLSGASRVIFNSELQRQLYEKQYALPHAKTATIYNPVPTLDLQGLERGSATSEFIFWGRLIVMKNVSTLIRAFAHATLPETYRLTIIGDGPQRENLATLIKELHQEDRITMLSAMPNWEALARVKDARAYILPSWTDISPNQVCEAFAIGLPALVTRENYLSFRDQLPESFDPHSVDELTAKLEMLADDSHYEEFSRRFREISYAKSWDDVSSEHQVLFESVRREAL